MGLFGHHATELAMVTADQGRHDSGASGTMTPQQNWGLMLEVTSGFRSDVGRVRALNEDSVLCGRLIWAVADGMGGHAAGDVASAIVIDVLTELDANPALRPQDVGAAIAHANGRILHHAAQAPESWGMGTTVAGVALVQVAGADHWAIFHVGDSRVYRCQGGRLTRATVDHSETEELVMEGQITEEQARTHANRNVITRSVGTDPAPALDLWLLPTTPGERFLICSDGLSSEVADEDIAAVVVGQTDPAIAADRLTELALEAGGRDNISVIVLDVSAEATGEVDEITRPRPIR